jgi:hypothetical protein
MTRFVDGFTKTRKTFADDYVARVTTSLTSRVHFTKNKKVQVEEAMHNMKVNSQNELDRYNSENHFSANGYWDSIISKFPFRVAVWGLQRLCFTGIYYAYEDYLKHLCRIVSKDHGLWFGRADLAGDLIASHLGELVKLECWTDDRIDTCRLIRNALAHSGGIETTELAKKNHGLAILDVERDGMPTRREIQIMPSDNRQLFGYITSRAETATIAALARLI